MPRNLWSGRERRVVEADWNWTVGESPTLGLIGLALLGIVLLAYFRHRVARW